MSDDTLIRGAPDRQRINLSQEHEIRYWTEKLGVTREELQRAVEAVGPMAVAVEQQLRRGDRRSQ